jgi:hypothetical protein
MATKSLPETDHIVRHVPFKLLDGQGLPLPQAFELRPNEKYLSASWLEFFSGGRAAELAGCATLMSHYRQIKSHDVLAVGNVGEIKDACAEFDQKIRIVGEQDSDNLNLAYVAVRQVRTDNLELLELLAQDVWSDVTSAAIPIAAVGPWRKK